MNNNQQFHTTLLLLSSTAALLLLKAKGKDKKKRKKRRWWVRPVYRKKYSQSDYNNLLQEMRMQDTEMFFHYTQMSVQQFDKLLSLVGPQLKKTSNRPSLSEGCRLAMTLRFLATGDAIPSIAFSYRCGRSTVCEVYRETCKVIWDTLNEVVMKLPNTNSWIEKMNYFSRFQLPNCCGAVDGKHVAIKCPNKSGSMYFNYKKFYSIVLLAVCDAKYNFTYINVGAYGSESDGGIFRRSSLGCCLQNKTLDLQKNLLLPGTDISFPSFFVGDEAFPLTENLLRPYSGRFLLEDKQIFNYRLSRARRCIENTLGILAARWRIFHRPINAHPESVDLIIKATVCLHNYIKMNESHKNYCSQSFADHEVNGTIHPGEWRNIINEGNALRTLATLARRFGTRNAPRTAFVNRDIMKVYVNTVGAVEWQVDYVRRK